MSTAEFRDVINKDIKEFWFKNGTLRNPEIATNACRKNQQ